MKRLTQLNLFTLLVIPPKNESLTQLNQAYDEFVEMVFSISTTEPSLISLYHLLSYARIELENLHHHTEHGELKKKSAPLLF